MKNLETCLFQFPKFFSGYTPPPSTLCHNWTFLQPLIVCRSFVASPPSLQFEREFIYWILMSFVDGPNHIGVNYDLNNDGSFSPFPKIVLLKGSDCPQGSLQSNCWCSELIIGFPSFISTYILLNFHSSSLPSHVLIKFACKSSYRTYYTHERYVKERRLSRQWDVP